MTAAPSPLALAESPAGCLLGAMLDRDDAQTQRDIDDAVRSVLGGGGWPVGSVA